MKEILARTGYGIVKSVRGTATRSISQMGTTRSIPVVGHVIAADARKCDGERDRARSYFLSEELQKTARLLTFWLLIVPSALRLYIDYIV